MIDDKFFKDLGNFRWGDAMSKLIDGPCYKVPTIYKPNGYLYVAWKIPDSEFLDMTVERLMDCYAEPAMRAMANEINKYDVCLCATQEVPPSVEVWSKCYREEAVPVRLTVAYESLIQTGPPGHRFIIDLMSDLLTKKEAE
jgi:hypothetical protein